MPESTSNERDDELAEIKRHCDELSHKYDSVMIFVTRVSPKNNGTVNIDQGEGNWFARYGQIKTWITRQEALSAKEAIDASGEGGS